MLRCRRGVLACLHMLLLRCDILDTFPLVTVIPFVNAQVKILEATLSDVSGYGTGSGEHPTSPVAVTLTLKLTAARSLFAGDPVSSVPAT